MSLHKMMPVVLSVVISVLLGVPIVGGQTTWYVDDDAPYDPENSIEDGTEAFPFNTIQEGINAASHYDHDTVWVLDGTYTGTDNKNLVFGGRAITVRSENGPENCTIDCEGSGRGFSFGSGDSDASIDGFTITDGVGSYGGGVACQSSSPTIANCTITDNYATYSGGGIYCYYADATIVDCTIANNSAGYLYSGGGIAVQGSNATIVNCAIVENSASVGGGYGGGILVSDSGANAVIINCTVAGNTALAGGGLYVRSGAGIPTLTNCILWGDVPSEIVGGASVYYSDVQGGWTGAGSDNINSDPLFVDPVGGNYYLDTGSPCIDAGSDEAVPAWVTTDLDGNPRIGCAAVDMGAYESNFGTITCPEDVTLECPAVDTSPSNTGIATAVGSCDGGAVEVTHVDTVVDGACPGTYVITRTWSVVGNPGIACDQTITVVDTTVPELTPPADTTIECGASTDPASTGTASATDACDETPAVTYSDSAPGGSCPWTITRTWTATDACGNSSEPLEQIITVQDMTPPVLAVPPHVTIECDTSTTPGSTGMASATDVCDEAPVVTYSDSEVSGTCAGARTITRTWTATDACGNATTGDQTITVQDTTPPVLTCEDIIVSGVLGGAYVTLDAGVADNCDADPTVTFVPASGSFFETGVTEDVTATATDACGNTSTCTFNVMVSCFGVNSAAIGTKPDWCDGIALLEVTSTHDGEQLVGVYVPAEGEEKLAAITVVDDGANGPQEIDTSCTQPLEIGDVFGAYTVTDLVKIFEGDPDSLGNQLDIRGTFDPALLVDLPSDDVTFTIDDGHGHVLTFVIPAGSFEVSGNPKKQKFTYYSGDGGEVEINARFELGRCGFRLSVDGVQGTAAIVGTTLTIGLEVGPNAVEDVIEMEAKPNHLAYKRTSKLDCCAEYEGLATMQVTSDQGVFSVEPAPGEDRLPWLVVFDDGVNGPVTIPTAGAEPLDVGDVFGAYTVSEVVKNVGE